MLLFLREKTETHKEQVFADYPKRSIHINYQKTEIESEVMLKGEKKIESEVIHTIDSVTKFYYKIDSVTKLGE